MESFVPVAEYRPQLWRAGRARKSANHEAYKGSQALSFSFVALRVLRGSSFWLNTGTHFARAIFAGPVSQENLHPRTALIVLTALNLLNYADRNVLFAVQPLVQAEFHLNKEQIGYLTSAFLGFYMIAAPFVGPLADRYSRKLIIVLGAIFWSALTLLTAVTHTYTELLIRHTLVGVGEATFVTIAPTFVADLFEEKKRGRILGVFYLAIPVGSAAGYLLGGYLAPGHGWRFPFYIAAAPGFVLALLVSFLKEPERGQFDSLQETASRGTIRGLVGNCAFITATLGMAGMTV